MDITAFPGAGYLYFLFSNFARNGRHAGTPHERRIRELARQEERNRLGQDLHDSVKQQIYSIQTNLAAAEIRWATDFTGAQEAVLAAVARPGARCDGGNDRTPGSPPSRSC